jgi:hypothetical protein
MTILAALVAYKWRLAYLREKIGSRETQDATMSRRRRCAA